MYKCRWIRESGINEHRKGRPAKIILKTGVEHGFDYYVNKKAWMNILLFFDWLRIFYMYIGGTSGRNPFYPSTIVRHTVLKTLFLLLRMLKFFFTAQKNIKEATVVFRRYCSCQNSVQSLSNGPCPGPHRL